MPKHRTIAALVLLTVAGVAMSPPDVTAADHQDGPGVLADDQAADIGDLYAWHTAGGNVVFVLTFAGPFEAGGAERYHRDYIYTIHVDNTADPGLANTYDDPFPDSDTNDNQPDISMHIRFGQNPLGDWGVRFEGVPGCDDPIDGPVDTEHGDGVACRVRAGTFDDPFFFDLEGFNDTMLAIGDPPEANAGLKFDSVDMDPQPGHTDFFAGLNTHAIVIEIAADQLGGIGANTYLNVWAQAGVFQ